MTSLSVNPGALAVSKPWASPLPPLGNLEAYISAVGRLPMLTLEEEQECAKRLRDQNDLEAASRLVMSHLRLVVSVSRKYLGYGLPHGDLIQEGNIGLMKAVKRFDPERGVRLVSFAMHWIKAEIHEFILRNWRLVKIATTKAQRKLFFNLRSLKPTLDTLSSSEIRAIATKLGVKPEDVVEMETRLSGQDIALESSGDDEDERFAPIGYLRDPGAEPSQVFEVEQNERLSADGLAHALESLDPRSRRIIEARWLAEKDPATLHDLAAEFNVSAERIRQIEAKAMQKMKGLLSAA